MSYRYEIHAGEGGGDAALFAAELGQALSKSFAGCTVNAGRLVSVESAVCL